MWKRWRMSTHMRLIMRVALAFWVCLCAAHVNLHEKAAAYANHDFLAKARSSTELWKEVAARHALGHSLCHSLNHSLGHSCPSPRSGKP